MANTKISEYDTFDELAKAYFANSVTPSVSKLLTIIGDKFTDNRMSLSDMVDKAAEFRVLQLTEEVAKDMDGTLDKYLRAPDAKANLVELFGEHALKESDYDEAQGKIAVANQDISNFAERYSGSTLEALTGALETEKAEHDLVLSGYHDNFVSGVQEMLTLFDSELHGDPSIEIAKNVEEAGLSLKEFPVYISSTQQEDGDFNIDVLTPFAEEHDEAAIVLFGALQLKTLEYLDATSDILLNWQDLSENGSHVYRAVSVTKTHEQDDLSNILSATDLALKAGFQETILPALGIDLKVVTSTSSSIPSLSLESEVDEPAAPTEQPKATTETDSESVYASLAGLEGPMRTKMALVAANILYKESLKGEEAERLGGRYLLEQVTQNPNIGPQNRGLITKALKVLRNADVIGLEGQKAAGTYAWGKDTELKPIDLVAKLTDKENPIGAYTNKLDETPTEAPVKTSAEPIVPPSYDISDSSLRRQVIMNIFMDNAKDARANPEYVGDESVRNIFEAMQEVYNPDVSHKSITADVNRLKNSGLLVYTQGGPHARNSRYKISGNYGKIRMASVVDSLRKNAQANLDKGFSEEALHEVVTHSVQIPLADNTIEKALEQMPDKLDKWESFDNDGTTEYRLARTVTRKDSPGSPPLDI